ncbi:MAG: CoB--CoM heterodisulfide reductase iron-sulfur subunit A family protein [Breznakibacter sp.]|nr:CoB--CoM heterodisulfide reductase iron-sulfur subunit A family protein [Breznakibacter sp.]
MTNQSQNITIVGGGVAGMQMALQLSGLGFSITLLEKEAILGGKVANWANIFPLNAKGSTLTNRLIAEIKSSNVLLQLSTEFQSLKRDVNDWSVITNRGVLENQQAVVMADGFKLFNPSVKEELGYGLFKSVITASELEEMFDDGRLKKLATSDNFSVAFVHCVGSRDRQINCEHCSKICCMVGVKQAVEIKKRYPQSKVYNFYMDLRMYDEGFEELYYEAQATHKVNFVRGRVSEIAETIDKRLLVKAEDTLLRKPLAGTFDLVVLLTGYEKRDKEVNAPLFYPKSSLVSTTIKETIAEANSTSLEILNYFKTLQN